MLAGGSSRRHVSAAVGARPGSRPAAPDCGSHTHQRGRGVVSWPAELIPRCGHSVSATSTYRLPQTGHADYGQARQAHGDARLSLPALPESGVICDRRAGRDDDYPGHELHVLGFDFRRAPVRRRDRRDRRDGVQMCGLVPLVGKAARKSMARTIRQRNRGRRTNLGFRGPATVVDPVVPGWINYDGRFYKSELMNFLEQQINPFLVKWMVRKGQAAARQAESASQGTNR